MTERSLELAIADLWLPESGSDVWEIGAVTPYYWPGRVRHVVDPVDKHSFVTERSSFLDRSYAGCRVLSISTFEHIGYPQYGLPADSELVAKAFVKLFGESPCFLITTPAGYNPVADAFVGDTANLPEDVVHRYFERSLIGNDWRQLPHAPSVRPPYGRPSFSPQAWANGVSILERGGLLARALAKLNGAKQVS